jgi:xylan 1,4-beta-xylosidase
MALVLASPTSAQARTADNDGCVVVDQHGAVSVRRESPGQAETFQWTETFSGDLTLMSLASYRDLRVEPANGRILADSPGPRPDGRDGVRFQWRIR